MRMEIGSPSGAIFSTITTSPGMQPISINFNSRSDVSKPLMRPRSPAFKFDNFILAIKATSIVKSLPKFCFMEDDIRKIRFHYLTPRFSFNNRNRIKVFLLRQLEKENKTVDAINYIFCNDDYLTEINRQYLHHNTLTDIISFELSLKDKPLLADIYISIERVKENATIFKTTFQNELLRVIFHGVLHLSGYKDKGEVQQQEMRKKEEEYLKCYYVSHNTVSH